MQEFLLKNREIKHETSKRLQARINLLSVEYLEGLLNRINTGVIWSESETNWNWEVYIMLKNDKLGVRCTDGNRKPYT